ncbi:MAG: hypothetical protein QME47_03215 [Candidatus Thermoplasmatota archaeon]|nr:hypothetical protein [Candidatus Thermoplasmatota archaeon]
MSSREKEEKLRKIESYLHDKEAELVLKEEELSRREEEQRLGTEKLKRELYELEKISGAKNISTLDDKMRMTEGLAKLEYELKSKEEELRNRADKLKLMEVALAKEEGRIAWLEIENGA